tara:strand:- start:6424 stop:6762 length:339 start_codon:yes stop_codon:yes gene_type:complete
MYNCECGFGFHIVGKTLKMIQAHDVEVGDEIIWLSGSSNIGYKSAAKVTKTKRKGDFITIQFKRCECDRGFTGVEPINYRSSSDAQRVDPVGLIKYAYTTIFGLVVKDQPQN